MDKNALNSSDQIMDLANAYWKSCLLFSGIQIQLFDLLNNKNLDSDTICRASGMDLRTGTIFLDACTAIGLLEKEGALYTNSQAANLCLCRESTFNLLDAIPYNMMNYPVWGNLINTLKTGTPAKSETSHLGFDEERTKKFVESMHSKTLAMGQAIIAAIDLSGVNSLLDVGGCAGTYSYFALNKAAHLTAQVFDLEPIIRIGKNIMEKLGYAERITFLAGDYHKDQFPGTYDLIFLFGMMHQEPASFCQELLSRAYQSLNKGGRVVILDVMLNADKITPPFAALFSMNMALTHQTGWVFSDEELKTWLTATHFTAIRQIALPPFIPYKMVEAAK